MTCQLQTSEPTRERVVGIVRSLVGRVDGLPTVRFRHQGRNPATGLDCAGLLIWSAHEAGLNLEFDFTTYERYPDGKTVKRLFEENLVKRPMGLHDALPGDVVLLHDIDLRWPMHMGILTDGPDGVLSIVHSWIQAKGVVETRIPKEWTFRVAGVYAFAALLEAPWLIRPH